jgi:hypothetical protein
MTADRTTMDRRTGWLLVAIGGLLALAIQLTAPVGVPLFDGVVVQEPYRFLHPGSGQAGAPTSFDQGRTVTGDRSPALAASTLEQPPQAQLIANAGAFQLTAGATEVRAVIEPVDPPVAPPEGAIAGNAYRFSVTDQTGSALTIATCDGCVSLVLRAPDGTGDASIMRLSGDTWTSVETVHAGTVGLYQTNPMALGIMAVVTTGAARPGGLAGTGIDPVFFVLGAAIVVIFLAFMALLVLRSGDPGAAAARGLGPSSRVPSKRKRPPRPPSGRSDR